MLALMLVVTAVCVALIVAGATMLPLDEAPVTTGTQALGVALLAIGIVAVCIVPVLLLMGFFTIQPNQAACSSCSATTRAPCATRASTGRTRSTPATPAPPWTRKRASPWGSPRRYRCAPARTTASTSR